MMSRRWLGRGGVAIAAVSCVSAALALLPLPANWYLGWTLVIAAPLVVAAILGAVNDFAQVALMLLVAAGTGWLTTFDGIACTPLANVVVVFPACIAAAAIYEFFRRRFVVREG